jgi:hypothetical protein
VPFVDRHWQGQAVARALPGARPGGPHTVRPTLERSREKRVG